MITMTYEEILDAQGYLYWKTVGYSMEPLIKEGRDTIIIKKKSAERLKKYDIALFKRPGVVGRGHYVLHRVLKVNDDGTYWIVGDNCSSGEIVKEENILGVLDLLVRKGKNVKMTDRGFRIYTHLWCDCLPIRFFYVKYKTYPRRAVRKLLRMVGLKK